MTVDDSTQTHKWLRGLYAPLTEELTAFELPVTGRLPGRARRALPAQRPEPGRSGRPGRRSTGSPATAWSTGSGCATAGPSGTATAGCARRRSARPSARRPSRGSATAAWTPPTPTSSGSPGARTPSSRPAGGRWSCPTSWRRSATATSAARCPTATRPTRRSIRRPAPLHAIAYHWALPHLQYIVVGADGLVSKVEPIEVDGGPMVHDCSITERWMVVYDLPVTFDLDAAMGGATLPVPLERGPRRSRSGSCRSAAAGPTCAGSRWRRATCSTRSTRSTTATASCSTSCATTACSTAARCSRTKVDAACCGAGRSTRRRAGSTSSSCRTSRSSSHASTSAPSVVATRWAGHRPSDATTTGSDFGGRLVRIDGATGDAQLVDLGAGRLGGEWVMVPRGRRPRRTAG